MKFVGRALRGIHTESFMYTATNEHAKGDAVLIPGSTITRGHLFLFTKRLLMHVGKHGLTEDQ